MEPNSSGRFSINVADRMIDLTDEEIVSRLTNFEDNFVERKSTGDSKDWLKTVVGFANSVPIGYPAILFVGVKNDGTIEGNANLDAVQQSFSRTLNEAYPPVYYTTKILRSQDGKQFLAIIVPGSPLRPHFAGHSYVRVGSETRKASEEQFNTLIVQRNSKVRQIISMVGQAVTWQMVGGQRGGAEATRWNPLSERAGLGVSDRGQAYHKPTRAIRACRSTCRGRFRLLWE